MGFHDSAEAQALARRWIIGSASYGQGLRAQRLERYRLSRHHQIGDDVLREVLLTWYE